MQTTVLDFIHRCGFLCLIATLTLMLSQGLVEAGNLEPRTGVLIAPDDIPIRYLTYGVGSPTLVFVHGISCDQSYWKKQVIPFSRDFRVVTVDLAGHGESGMGRKEWSMEAYGGDVSAVDTYVDFRTWIQSMFVEGADQSWVEQIVTDMQTSPPEVMIPSMESALRLMFGHEVTTVLQGLDVPVIVINSDLGSTEVESMQRDGQSVPLSVCTPQNVLGDGKFCGAHI